MKVLIIEDEELAAGTLAKMLHKIDPNIQVLDVLGTVEAAVDWLGENAAELIFMDIHLGDGESFQIFRRTKVNCPVIFTTAYDQYTLKAFKNQGIDYLLKPFDQGDVSAALSKLNSIRNVPYVGPTHTVAIPAPEERGRFMVKSGKLIKSVDVEDIAYFMAEDKYLFLITHNGQRYIIDETVVSLEPQLNTREFFRVNRKFIIHIRAIREMYMLSRNRVRVALHPSPPAGVDVIVSEERADSFKNWLNR